MSGASLRLCSVVALVVILSQSTRAGFLDVSIRGEEGTKPSTAWGSVAGTSNAWASVGEYYDGGVGASYDLSVSGTTDEDPILTITKDVTNGTGLTWVGYTIWLVNPGLNTFVGTPTSSGMTLTSMTPTALTFGLPAPVPNGGNVSFTFDINIPTTGGFGFTISQAPTLVPEPASVALLGFAVAAGVCWYRRR